jgi:hypothetical protein
MARWAAGLLLCSIAAQAPGQSRGGAGTMAAPDHFLHTNLTQLVWTARIYQYDQQVPTTSSIRIEFNSASFLGSAGGLSIGAMIQNVIHQFPDDAIAVQAVPGLGLYLSSFQSELPDSRYGVELLANSGAPPQFARCFQNIDGSGYVGKNIYTRQNIGDLGLTKPIVVTWTVTRGATLTNPVGNFSKNLAGDWVPLIGTFITWNFRVSINSREYNVANFFLPIELVEFLHPATPLILHQEYQYLNSPSSLLDVAKGFVRYTDMKASDGVDSYPLSDWKTVWEIDDGVGNHDQRFGRAADATAVVSRVGHDSDVSECVRDAGISFAKGLSVLAADAIAGSLQINYPPTFSWTATSNANWFTLTSSPFGVGSATLVYRSAANESDQSRTATISIGGEEIVVTQSGWFSQSMLATDFAKSLWWSYDVVSASSVTTMNSRGTATFQNGSVATTGPAFGGSDGIGFVVLDASRGVVILHPGGGTLSTAASFHVPQEGIYTITGAFARANDAANAGDGVVVSVATNDGPASFTATIPASALVNTSDYFASSGARAFSLTQALRSGDVVRFLVSNGSKQDYTFDATALRVNVTRTANLGTRHRAVRH